jgi:hypothetical protein
MSDLHDASSCRSFSSFDFNASMVFRR